MSSNSDKIFERYSKHPEDGRAEWTRTNSLEFHYTKKQLESFITSDSRILEIGCATGYYGMYYAERCREYVGVDIFPAHIDRFRQKIAETGLKNISCQVGDATALTDIPDESFDVVLCLGPMYHLPQKERGQVLSECYRVCKRDGIAAFAYINKIGVYAGACVYDASKDYYPTEKANEAVLKNGTDDMRPELFYYSTPEEIEKTSSAHGFEKISDLGTNFMVTMSVVDSMSDEKFELMRPLYDQMTSHESCTGMSDHALLICRRK